MRVLLLFTGIVCCRVAVCVATVCCIVVYGCLGRRSFLLDGVADNHHPDEVQMVEVFRVYVHVNPVNFLQLVILSDIRVIIIILSRNEKDSQDSSHQTSKLSPVKSIFAWIVDLASLPKELTHGIPRSVQRRISLFLSIQLCVISSVFQSCYN